MKFWIIAVLGLLASQTLYALDKKAEPTIGSLSRLSRIIFEMKAVLVEPQLKKVLTANGDNAITGLRPSAYGEYSVQANDKCALARIKYLDLDFILPHVAVKSVPCEPRELIDKEIGYDESVKDLYTILSIPNLIHKFDYKNFPAYFEAMKDPLTSLSIRTWSAASHSYDLQGGFTGRNGGFEFRNLSGEYTVIVEQNSKLKILREDGPGGGASVGN